MIYVFSREQIFSSILVLLHLSLLQDCSVLTRVVGCGQCKMKQQLYETAVLYSFTRWSIRCCHKKGCRRDSGRQSLFTHRSQRGSHCIARGATRRASWQCVQPSRQGAERSGAGREGKEGTFGKCLSCGSEWSTPAKRHEIQLAQLMSLGHSQGKKCYCTRGQAYHSCSWSSGQGAERLFARMLRQQETVKLYVL